MSQTVHIAQSHGSPDAIGPGADRCVDLDVVAVENLLHRLAETRTAKRPAVPARPLGSLKMAAVGAVCLICVPGCAAAPETQPIKADRLPLIAVVSDANYFNDATYFDEAKLRDDDDLVEQPSLRGSVEDVVLPVSMTPPAATARRKFRHGPQANFAAAPTETPEPVSPPRSLLEKLFSVFVPEFSQPPSQRQT